MQPSQCFKSEGLESHRRLLTRQQDSIAGLLVLGSARGGPTRHEVQQVGNCEWGRANDVDIKVTPLDTVETAKGCENNGYKLFGLHLSTRPVRPGPSSAKALFYPVLSVSLSPSPMRLVK
eukprot:jgi/Botrbrau1/20936/Bobra.0135s0064.1